MKNLKSVLLTALALLLLASCTKENTPTNNIPTNNIPVTPSQRKQIKTFKFEGFVEQAVIDEEQKTIEAVLPWGTDLTTLIPIITISPKATISPASGVVTDFTDPVIYTVTAEDSSYVEYTATVTLEDPTVEDNPFFGIWGVERIDYYNTDYYGNPIPYTQTTYYFTPGDPDDGIDLVFRADYSGEMRDRSRDTIWIDVNTCIVCPDTTIVSPYTYSYNEDEAILWISMESATPITHQLKIAEFSNDSFVYENEYADNYVEKAWLRRLSGTPNQSTGRKSQNRSYRKGSLLSGLN